jgi:hypothetical protein
MRKLKKNQIVEGAEEVLKPLIKFVDLKSFFKKTMLLILILLFVNVSGTTPGSSTDSMTACGNVVHKSETEIYVDILKMKMKNQLIEEVGMYITKVAPLSQLTPELVVDKCLEYKTDIIFVLSQGLLESHFGTKGIAKKTNSVWNVGAYDNQRPRNWYPNQDESLEPYLKLVNDKYLINITTDGDTIYKDLNHLVQDRGYTNYQGNRFASAKGYENAMRKLMVKIDMETSISLYQDILTLSDALTLAFFNPQPTTEYDDFYAQN